MCGENASNPAETVLMVIATSWMSHAHAEAAAAAQTASDAWAYISGSTFASAMREAEQAAALLREAMEDAIELQVPLVAEVHQGENWACSK